MEQQSLREQQLQALVIKCYDDYCFYNRMDIELRKQFVQEQTRIAKESFVLPYLPIYLTTRCTLNCAKCNNLMPYFTNGRPEFDVKIIKSSLQQILGIVQELIFCELVGGEPFLYNDFEEILDFLSGQKKIRQIVVVTNATVIPADEVARKLADYKVIVRVSDYGLFDKMSRFVAQMDHFGVNVRIQQDMKWNDPGGIQQRGRSEEALREQYRRCEFSLKCKYLCEDRLFTCARAASLSLLGKYASDNDSLKIDEFLSENTLKEFYLREKGDICDYCDLWSESGGMEIPSAEQVGGNDIQRSGYTIISNYELNHYKKNSRAYESIMEREDGS